MQEQRDSRRPDQRSSSSQVTRTAPRGASWTSALRARARGWPRLTRALLALALACGLSGLLAPTLARWVSPELSVALAYQRDPGAALGSAIRITLAPEPGGEGQRSSYDPWGARWRLGFRAGQDWPAGPWDGGRLARTKIYSLGPDGVDQRGRGDDLLVPARPGQQRFGPVALLVAGGSVAKDGWRYDQRRMVGPLVDSPRALELLLIARPLGLGLAAACLLLAALWSPAARPRSDKAWLERLRAFALALALFALGGLAFAASSWPWVPLTSWIDTFSATGLVIALRCLALASWGGASLLAALALRAGAPPAEGPAPNPEGASGRRVAALALSALAALSACGSVAASREPAVLGRSLSGWTKALRSRDGEHLAALYALAQLGPAAAPAAPEVIELLRDAERRGDGMQVPPLAIHALACMGEGALPLLLDDLRARPTLMADDYASQALSLMGPAAAPALPELRRVLTSEAHRDRIRHHRAIRVLGGIGPAAAPACADLIAWLGDDERPAEERRDALIALARMGTPAAVAAIARQLERAPREADSRTYELSKTILWALTELGPAAKEHAPALLRRTFGDPRDEAFLLQPRRAAEAALHLTGGDFDPALVEPGLARRDREVRLAAEMLLTARTLYAE